MFDGHEHRVEKHQHDDEPIEPLRFYHAPDPEPKTFLGPPHGRANAFFPHPVFECGRARETWTTTRKQTSPRCPLISHHVQNAANGTLLPAVYQNELIVKHRQVARPYDARFVIYTVSFRHHYYYYYRLFISNSRTIWVNLEIIYTYYLRRSNVIIVIIQSSCSSQPLWCLYLTSVFIFRKLENQ